ncbi:MAG: nuclear transport factor 2 family protein [Myxococcota bacterium]
MTAGEGKRLIEAFYAAFNAGDRDAYCALLHSDFRAEISGQGEVSGEMDRDAFSRMVFERVGQVFPGGLSVAIEEQIAEGDRVASRVVVSGRTKSGRAYRNPACHFFRVRDGRVLEIVEYFDTALSRAAFEEAASR